MSKKGLVFGVFDGLHQGHIYFLNQALQKCDELSVVLTLEEVVKTLKGKIPRHSYTERANAINAFNPDLKIIAGDARPGTWDVLKKNKPDIVFLGYDQHSIAYELEKMNVPFIFIDSHVPEKYKSSFITR